MQCFKLCALMMIADARDNKALYEEVFKEFYDWGKQISISGIAGVNEPNLMPFRCSLSQVKLLSRDVKKSFDDIPTVDGDALQLLLAAFKLLARPPTLPILSLAAGLRVEFSLVSLRLVGVLRLKDPRGDESL